MAPFRNPPIISAAPTNDQVLVYDAAEDAWVPTAIASIGSPLTVPQAPPSEPTATAVDVPTTGATNTTPYGFTTAAQPNDIAAAVNALVTDVATLIVWADALQAALVTAGILS